MPQTKPKIFVISEHTGAVGAEVCSIALAEDGAALASHISSNAMWARHAMGFTSRWKHEAYVAHYPDGYDLVDLIGMTKEQLDNHTGFQKAWANNQAQEAAEEERRSDGGPSGPWVSGE